MLAYIRRDIACGQGETMCVGNGRPERRLDLAEIALLLGFSEQSAFTRAFRQWTGKAPAQWRKQALAETRSPP